MVGEEADVSGTLASMRLNKPQLCSGTENKVSSLTDFGRTDDRSDISRGVVSMKRLIDIVGRCADELL